VYVDSSLLARAYLADEPGHDDAETMLADPHLGLITGTWTRVEVSEALVRAARAGRGDERGLLSLLDADLSEDGSVAVITAPQDDIEDHALHLVRKYAIRAMDARHLAVAVLVAPSLVEPGEEVGFATRDEAQSSVARTLGLQTV